MFLESGVRPRYECGEIESAKFSCYMYRPVMPVLLKKQKEDKREQFAGWMLSARSEAAGMPEMELAAKYKKSGSLLYWIPKSNGP